MSQKLDESFENFEKLYFRESEDILSFFQSVINAMHEPEYSAGTVRLYMNCLDKLDRFTKGKTINLYDIDYHFISEFDSYLSDLGLVKNTRASQLKKLNKVLNDARKRGLIQLNPFVNFQIKQEKTHRVFLVKDELKKLNKVYDSDSLSENLQNTLHAFLFSCYTGLRHSDVVRIKYGDIKDNTVDLLLKKKTSHGHKRLIVPLSKKAQSFLDSSLGDEHLLFPNLITSTKCAHHLKAIAGACGIKKSVTFHAARHTFATISLGLGIDLKKVSELLGHDSIKTTEVYAHLVEEHLKKAVNKWDSF